MILREGCARDDIFYTKIVNCEILICIFLRLNMNHYTTETSIQDIAEAARQRSLESMIRDEMTYFHRGLHDIHHVIWTPRPAINNIASSSSVEPNIEHVTKTLQPVTDNNISCRTHADFLRMTFEEYLLKKYNIIRKDVEIVQRQLGDISFLTALSLLISNQGDLVCAILHFDDVPHYHTDDCIIYQADIEMMQAECAGAAFATCLSSLKMYRGDTYGAILYYRNRILHDSMDIDKHSDNHLLKKREHEDDNTPNKKRKLSF